MTKKIHLLYTVLFATAAVLLLLHHTLYQPALAQGDHGRDLYAAAAVLEGQVPYRDFWWVYGPLMPYYYGLIFKIGGISIAAMLWGQLILQILAGLAFFHILLLFVSPMVAFIGGLWFVFMTPDFFYTYNHIGGIAALLGVTYALLAYIRRQNPGDLYPGLAFCFLLLFIKINFGLTALTALVLTPWLMSKIDSGFSLKETRRFYLWALIAVPGLTLALYTLLVHDLPTAYIRQCFPYLRGDQPYEAALGQTILMWWDNIAQNINHNWPNRLFALLINIAFLRTLLWIFRQKPLDKERRDVLAALTGLAMLYVLSMQEFWASGVIYRSYWAQPFSFLLMFLVLGVNLRDQRAWMRGLFCAVLFCVLVIRQSDQIQIISHKELPGQYLDLPRGQVLLGNEPGWIQTVQDSVQFLNRHVPPGETFFALPYDYLYYYLCGRPVPTRLQIFFEHIKITPQEEQDVIADLERHKVNYILLSSRAYAQREHGLGLLGVTYCPRLAAYLFETFEPIAQFGDWTHEPGWAWNHGTKILKRKSPR